MLQSFCEVTRGLLIWDFPPGLILFAAVWFFAGAGIGPCLRSLRVGDLWRRLRGRPTTGSWLDSDGGGDG